jgi:hypothetical protein
LFRVGRMPAFSSTAFTNDDDSSAIVNTPVISSTRLELLEGQTRCAVGA